MRCLTSLKTTGKSFVMEKTENTRRVRKALILSMRGKNTPRILITGALM